MKAGELVGLRMICPVFKCGYEWDATAEAAAAEVVAVGLTRSRAVGQTPPKCPKCGATMLARPGAFKCYRHEPWAVIRDTSALTRSPAVDVVEVAR